MQIVKVFNIGSNYFFAGIDGFKSKDDDVLEIIEDSKSFKHYRQYSDFNKKCHFQFVNKPKKEFLDWHIEHNIPMSVGKFLIPEVNEFFGITIEDLKSLMDKQMPILDHKHKYEAVIWDSYIENNSFTLTDAQRSRAYESYKKAREQ